MWHVGVLDLRGRHVKAGGTNLNGFEVDWRLHSPVLSGKMKFS